MEGKNSRSLRFGCGCSLYNHAFRAIIGLRLGRQVKPGSLANSPTRRISTRHLATMGKARGLARAWGPRLRVLSLSSLVGNPKWGRRRGGGEEEVLVSEVSIDADKGGEFFIDTDRHVRAGPTPSFMEMEMGLEGGGFIMRCNVRGEGKSSKPMVQLAMRHITCIEDAAIFMALAAAVDLSIDACWPFRKRKLKIGRGYRHSW